MTKQILPRVWEIAAAAALALFLISSSVLFTLNFRPLYYAEIGPLNIPERSGLTEDEIRANYDAVIDYLSITGPDELVLPTLSMSENGRVHFEEVKQIFVKLEVIFALSLAATVFFLLRALRKSKDPGATPGKNNYRFLRIGAIISVALPSAIGIIIAINWEWFFTVLFHGLLFDNDYWMFDPRTDPIINILPDRFFMHCCIMVIALIVLSAAAFYYIGYRLDKKAEKA